MRLSIPLLPVFLAALVAALLPASARADGLPVLGIDVGSTGVASNADAARYLALPAGADDRRAKSRSVGVKSWRGDRCQARSRFQRSPTTVPRAASLRRQRHCSDRAASRVSARDDEDARPEQRQPQAAATRDVAGDFSFDAISPTGCGCTSSTTPSPTDPTRYLVQAFDVQRGRLLAKPIVDPKAPGEKMRGNPLARDDERRWPLGLHALRRRRRHALRTRPRHRCPIGALHRSEGAVCHRSVRRRSRRDRCNAPIGQRCRGRVRRAWRRRRRRACRPSGHRRSSSEPTGCRASSRRAPWDRRSASPAGVRVARRKPGLGTWSGRSARCSGRSTATSRSVRSRRS